MTKPTTEVSAALLLSRARDLIAKPEHFATGYPAKDIHGHPVSPDGYDAARFCSLGALHRVTVEAGHSPSRCASMDRAVWTLSNVVGELSGAVTAIATYNDTAGHEAVLQAFDEAIAREGGRP